MEQEIVEEKAKTNPGMYVLLAGLILIFIGAAINFYNVMFKETEEPVNNSDNNTGTMTEKFTAPTDLAEVNQKLNADLGTYLKLKYDSSTDSGKDLLQTPLKRIELIYILLEESGNVEHANNPGNPFPYVTEEVFKAKYEEVYGSTAQYDTDMSSAYSAGPYVKNVLGEDGYIGWAAEIKEVAVERNVEISSIDYDETTGVVTLTGTYTDSSLGTTQASGLFELTYSKDNYIISLTLTEIQ